VPPGAALAALSPASGTFWTTTSAPTHPPRRPVAALRPEPRNAIAPQDLGLSPKPPGPREHFLEALPLAPPTAATLASLAALHPREAPPHVPPASAPAPVVTEEAFQRVLKRLPRGSAPGLSGWTYDHLRAATGTSPTATTAILALINLIISGIPLDIPAFHASARIALTKPGGSGLRPIAIGEVWVRLASLCAMAACQDAGPALAPLQLGVSVPGDSQSVSHTLWSGLSCCPGDVTLQLDFRNTCNSVSRTALLQAVASRAPRLLPFAAWTYRSHGPLVVRGAPADAPPLTSQSGVCQGDPCGPLLFALALQGPFERVREVFLDVHMVAYADDMHLQGPPEAAIEAFWLLVTATALIDLTPPIPKCAAYALSVVIPVKNSIWLTSSGPATYKATGRPVRVVVCNAPSQHTQTLVSTLLFSISAAS
jgi:hypothetical protein